ncbi:GH32 C-terminal domain-containing protein [Paenibacillus sp. S-38]|uniref:GH32 C-terminal domain-containing protein n=1 Tax=Paenibacillus sp. S-38 TaxID=3416710 RepID=UPI003CF69358
MIKKKLAQYLALMLIASNAALATVPESAFASNAETDTGLYKETFRPQFHYAPAKNWMNDPNGLVYYKGEYHLFYQHNPFGNGFGNLSWGHAVSKDLVHWTELGVAIPKDEKEDVFSGSIVVDFNNTSGLGTKDSPAMVAVYTSTADGKQSQALAYSTDYGRTFIKYSGNPVLDINSKAFRDPKVFWYEAKQEWIMAAVLADKRLVTFYSSPDLKNWTHLSDFGQQGAIGGAWECPDLFPLQDPNHPDQQKWVLIVNLNPGGVAGGSGSQYFIGNFDGTTFTPDATDSEDAPYTPPVGRALGNFDNGDFDGWTVSGSAFGDVPATDTLPDQQFVMNWMGAGYINGFHGHDETKGTLISPDFVIDKNYINFLVGGGKHPYVPGSTKNFSIPSGTTFAEFEGITFGDGWQATGDLANKAPAKGTLPGQGEVRSFVGTQLVNTFFDGDGAMGTINSPSFTINKHYINLLVGGGNHPWGTDVQPTSVNLIVDGKVVESATGSNNETLNWIHWNVDAYAGQTASIQIVDQNSGGWGHILVDQIMFSDEASQPVANDVSAKLMIDGQVVRHSTGNDDETLDWTSWDVSQFKGKTANIELADHNTGGWGHINADQFTLADEPAQPTHLIETNMKRARWVDYGKDNYAAVTYNNAPGGKRILIGWMNNWAYAGNTPTSPWRSAMTLPRELKLQSVNGQLQLIQSPVDALDQLRMPILDWSNFQVQPGVNVLSSVNGDKMEIEVEFNLTDATEFGFKVRKSETEETLIGYDAVQQKVFVDRTHSGNIGFHSDFPVRNEAPLVPKNDTIKLHIYLDWSSVEVFANDGEKVITDLIFPDPGSKGIELYTKDGSLQVNSLKLYQMRSSRRDETIKNIQLDNSKYQLSRNGTHQMTVRSLNLIPETSSVYQSVYQNVYVNKELTVYDYKDYGSNEDITDLAAYISADPGVVAVNSHGLLTGLKAGTTTVSAEYHGYRTSATVVVLEDGRTSSSDNSPTTSTVTTPVITTLPQNFNDKVVLKSTLKDSVAQADISTETIKNALEKAKTDENGIKTIVLDQQKLDGAKGYAVDLPVSYLNSISAAHQLEIRNEFGTIVVPGNMLANMNINSQSKVTLQLKASDKAAIPAEAAHSIGSRPVVEINALVDGQTIAWHNDAAPVKLSINYKPVQEELNNIEHLVVWYLDPTGAIIPVTNGKYDQSAGKVIFTTTHFSKYAVAYVNKTFQDINSFPWAKKQIEVLASKGIIQGAAETKFLPENNVTRADFMLMLVRTLELTADADSNFDDVKSSDYYYREIGIAKKLGITDGMGNNEFLPKEAITRQDMIVMLARALNITKKGALDSKIDIHTFDDYQDISDYAVDSANAMLGKGIVEGSDKRIRPLENTTRAEIAVVMYRILKLK